MASTFPVAGSQPRLFGSLTDERLAIGGRWFDALLLWGCPLVSALFVWAWIAGASLLPGAMRQTAIALLAGSVAVLTFAHLIAVAPRAYLNREVFEANKRRLTIVPIVLIAALLASPTLLICAAVVAVFWDVHHSAMQTFGLARIYDMKAGNGPTELRRTDLRLNWALYVGPIAAGASLAEHLASLDRLGPLGWSTIAAIPSLAQSNATGMTEIAIAAWLFILGWAAWDYRAAFARGYRMPAHKLAVVATTGFVSVAAWGLANPVAAFAIINLFHAVQYFALVWLKEGGRIEAGTAKIAGRRGAKGGPIGRAVALFLFLALCLAFGLAYHLFQDLRWLGGPFIACSLLHFWYDSFVWSVRRKQV